MENYEMCYPYNVQALIEFLETLPDYLPLQVKGEYGWMPLEVFVENGTVYFC